MARPRKLTPDQFKLKKRQWEREYAMRTRMACLIFYGGTPPECACCGEAEYKFLALDHLNGGGGKHRKQIRQENVGTLARWLKKHGFPQGFQVLCHNCNQAKGYYGACPHRQSKNAQN